ncbi:ATP-binding cassette domain-containing protein [Pseudothauera nasutitermitis]|uniref:ATP-binding cassette domain-containing protein n=1 Tax=Pseudothauera nasutitermitis TaxID=2565930 RepID=A0A4S4AZD6_9RHOO|nr:ATP-binding cassette domain-containing protein [Pseudothauera nasutitermitis]THF64741.1 ATP-binding cassette domain-containing protein [Pseudothauera nasutitermitis]
MNTVPAPRRLLARGVGHAYALRTVLEGIDFELPAGRVMALVGPSGCGKTTLLHLVAGLLAVREGRIESNFSTPASVFQQPRLLPWKNALDNIALGLKAAGVARAEREARAAELGVRVGLAADDLQKFPHQLSGGMQSRVALARALVLGPDLLLLDEPFSALDVGLKAELYALLAEHLAGREMAVLMITHDLMEAVRLSDDILVMAASPGRVVARFALDRPAARRDDDFVYRRTAELLRDATVRESFGLPPQVCAQTPEDAACETALQAVHTVRPGAAPARGGLRC